MHGSLLMHQGPLPLMNLLVCSTRLRNRGLMASSMKSAKYKLPLLCVHSKYELPQLKFLTASNDS